jgi:hypothetical protein
MVCLSVVNNIINIQHGICRDYANRPLSRSSISDSSQGQTGPSMAYLKTLFYGCVLCLVLLSMGCSSPDDTIMPTLTTERTDSHTQIVPTVSTQPDNPVNFPGSQDGKIPLRDFIITGFSSDCRPPCWYDLRPGETGTEDIQRFFDEVVNFQGSVDFWSEHTSVTVNPPLYLVPISGKISTGYQWNDPITKDHIAVAMYLDEAAQRLDGIVMIWGSRSASYADFSPGDLFQELGLPDHLLVGTTQTPELAIVYDDGLVFFTFGSIEGDFCIGEPQFTHDFHSATLILTYPLSKRLDELSALERQYFGRFIVEMESIETVTDFTVETLTQSILNGENVCLEIQH